MNIVNAMLDLVGDECKRVESCFLEPACGKGIFLVEILRRKLKTLTQEYKDNPKKYEEFLIVAIASIYGVDILTDNVFDSRNAMLDLLTTQYQTVFNNSLCDKIVRKISEILENNIIKGDFLKLSAPLLSNENNIFFKRQFDVVIGNPPYQLNLGNDGGNKSKAKAIYHLFVSQAKYLNPKYLTMIIPSRWMTRTSEGIPQVWIDNMLNDSKIAELHDFENPLDCFPKETTLKGGVIYFLWRRDYQGKCAYYFHQKGKEVPLYRKGYLKPKFANIVIRNPMDNFIIQKIVSKEGVYYSTDNFSTLVSPKDFFTNKKLLTSSWDEYLLEKTNSHYIKCYINKMNHNASYGWVSEEQIPLKNNNFKTIPLHKVFIPAAGGSGLDSQVIGTPFYGEPNSVCSQTYLVIGYDPVKHNFTQKQCENIISYIKTRFFRYLVRIKKKTQNGPRGVYQFVPLQDFNEPWNDEKLYKKYELSDDEIQFIESMIKPME